MPCAFSLGVSIAVGHATIHMNYLPKTFVT
jgi:hypothetical protein